MPSSYLTLVGPERGRGPAPVLSQLDRFELSVRPSTSRTDCDTYRINMSGRAGRNDREVAQWAAWFAAQRAPALLKRHGSRGVVIAELDFSNNELGDAALEAVLRSVLVAARRISSIKFHRNSMTRSDGVLHLVRRGLVHQVHLSHNLLPDAEMSRLVRAALEAHEPGGGGALYPLKNGWALWLRMEHNPGHGGALTDAAVRAGGARVCHASWQNGWTCTPFSCARHRRPPAVHVTYLEGGGLADGAQTTSFGQTKKESDRAVAAPQQQAERPAREAAAAVPAWGKLEAARGGPQAERRSASRWLDAATDDLRLLRAMRDEEEFPPLRPVRSTPEEPTAAEPPREPAAPEAQLQPPPPPPRRAKKTETEQVAPPPGMEHVRLMRQPFPVCQLADAATKVS